MVYHSTMATFLEPTPKHPPRSAPVTPQELTTAERAVRNDPEQLARIEAVLDDPSLAVPLEDLD